jgi:ABC-2 type transport system permease protein
VYFLDITFEHGVALFFVVELLRTLTALGLGILLSLFAETEFQVFQFLPLVIAPQIILGGTFIPVEELPLYRGGGIQLFSSRFSHPHTRVGIIRPT